MYSLRPSYLNTLSMPPRVAGVLRRLGEHMGRQELYRKQAPEMLENLRRVALIESTESSNRLEGIVADNQKRLRALVNERSQPENRTEGEIAGYRDVLDTIHQNFLCIHPFSDGNGRMARLLTLLALYHQGYEVGRYISLERVIEKTKESYYDTLLLSSQGWHEGKHNVWPWTEYFLGTLLAASAEFEMRFSRISSGRGSKTDTVKNAISAFVGDFTLHELENACPLVSRDMIRRVLADLKKATQVECLGRGPAAKWRKKR